MLGKIYVSARCAVRRPLRRMQIGVAKGAAKEVVRMVTSGRISPDAFSPRLEQMAKTGFGLIGVRQQTKVSANHSIRRRLAGLSFVGKIKFLVGNLFTLFVSAPFHRLVVRPPENCYATLA